MLKNVGDGWSTLRLVEVNDKEPNIFIVHPSYITDVPDDTLRAFLHYYEYGTGVVHYDLEGCEFFMILSCDGIYILSTECKTKQQDGSLPIVFHLNIDELAEELCQDIENDIENWAAFNVFDPEHGLDAVAEAKANLVQMIADIRSHVNARSAWWRDGDAGDDEEDVLFVEDEDEETDKCIPSEPEISLSSCKTAQETMDWILQGKSKVQCVVCNYPMSIQSTEDAEANINAILDAANVDCSQYNVPCYKEICGNLYIRFYHDEAELPDGVFPVPLSKLTAVLCKYAADHSNVELSPWHCVMVSPDYAEFMVLPATSDTEGWRYTYKLSAHALAIRVYTEDGEIPQGYVTVNHDVFAQISDEYNCRFERDLPEWWASLDTPQFSEDLCSNEDLPAKAIAAMLDTGYRVRDPKQEKVYRMDLN